MTIILKCPPLVLASLYAAGCGSKEYSELAAGSADGTPETVTDAARAYGDCTLGDAYGPYRGATTGDTHGRRCSSPGADISCPGTAA